MPNAELKPSNFVSAANQVGNSSSMLALSQLSSHSTSSIATSKLLLSTTPLPQELFAQRLASIRATGTEPRVYTCSARVPEDDEVDDDDSFETRRKARMDRMLMSPTGSHTARRAIGVSTTRRRPSVSVFGRGRSHTGAPRKRNSASMTAANLSRLRANQEDDDDNSSNRAELHILMRVEAALRQLEKENALAKEREHALAQEVQSLRDALRIKSAEKKHVESQFHHLLRETDEWKQVAQRAERTAAQLEDELLIAREEAQLLHSERVRLKHQNKELLTHVHRLDSLVYGRF